MGRSAFLGGDRGDRATWSREAERRHDAPDAILDTCVTTSQRRKLGRLYRRLTEVEYLTPDLLQAACFITLTCREAETADTVRRGWHRLQACLMRHGYVNYIVTSAVQEKRLAKYGAAVVHYHLVVLGHKRVPVGLVRAAWALGGTKHESAKSPQHAIRYMASYLHNNGGRLLWSYALLHRLPAGARPHANCYRYVKADPVNDFPGGIVNFGWGGTFPVNETMVYVPALGHIVPAVAPGPDHSLMWLCWRMWSDWEGARQHMRRSIEGENEFIDRLRRGAGPFNERPVSSRIRTREIFDDNSGGVI